MRMLSWTTVRNVGAKSDGLDIRKQGWIRGGWVCRWGLIIGHLTEMVVVQGQGADSWANIVQVPLRLRLIVQLLCPPMKNQPYHKHGKLSLLQWLQMKPPKSASMLLSNTNGDWSLRQGTPERLVKSSWPLCQKRMEQGMWTMLLPHISKCLLDLMLSKMGRNIRQTTPSQESNWAAQGLDRLMIPLLSVKGNQDGERAASLDEFEWEQADPLRYALAGTGAIWHQQKSLTHG